MVVLKTEEEINILMTALYELAESGKTDIKCPICGKPFRVAEENGVYGIECETEGCIRAIPRGL